MEAVSIIVLHGNFLDKKSKHFDDKIREQEVSYTSVVHAYKDISQIIFSEVVNRPDVLLLIRQAGQAQTETKAQLRKKLQQKMQHTYESLKNINLRQLHFHLPNNESFLRMHKPDRFGDNLTSIRLTIARVNKSKTFVYGFEEGRIYNGFRYVYPLFWDKEHIGSVETSVNYRAIIDKMESVSPLRVIFILKKEEVMRKVFQDLQKHYYPSDLSLDYMYEKRTLISAGRADNSIEDSLIRKINSSIRESV